MIHSNRLPVFAFALCMAISSATTVAGGWELSTLYQEVPGTRYVENGRFERAVRVSTRFLDKASSPLAGRHQRVATLTNLCISHIALREYDLAEVYCRRAAAEPIYRSITLNNLGVLHGLRGERELALQVLEMAAVSDCLGKCSDVTKLRKSLPRPTAHRNLARAEGMRTEDVDAYLALSSSSTIEEIEP